MTRLQRMRPPRRWKSASLTNLLTAQTLLRPRPVRTLPIAGTTIADPTKLQETIQKIAATRAAQAARRLRPVKVLLRSGGRSKSSERGNCHAQRAADSSRVAARSRVK